MVECLVGDINQVFLKLIVNAAHAIFDRVKIAFSCARKIRGYVLELAKVAGISQCWQVEAAALLSQIG